MSIIDLNVPPHTLITLMQLILAAICGGLIGVERDIHGRAAGLRTHLLVCTGSALYMIISKHVAGMQGSDVITDPGRIAAQIVTGIGFIGAGAIMKEGFSVRGITTAACLWVVAAIGMGLAVGEYTLSISCTMISLFALVFLQNVDKFYKRASYREMSITVNSDVDTSKIIDIINYNHIKIMFVDFHTNYETNIKILNLTLRIVHKGTTDKISRQLVTALEEDKIPIKEIRWVHGKM